tara:strand:- start:618 stop:1118 length:501 start_codon:yes stop_codon:yes gene_type:complete
MSKILKNKLLICVFTIFFVFFLDRVSKILILNLVELDGNLNIYINSFLNLVLVWNDGIGFGLFSSESSLFYNLFTALIILINLIIIYLIISSNSLRSFLFSLILGGSLGNLFDRFYYSAVPDFIDLNYNNFHWFIFNVADIFISLGVLCLIFVELFSNKEETANEN